MGRRRIGVAAVIAATCVLICSCGGGGATSVDAAGSGTRCTLPSIPDGTWIDTEGNSHNPRTDPTIPVPPQGHDPNTASAPSPTTTLSAAGQRAVEVATSDPVVGSVLS